MPSSNTISQSYDYITWWNIININNVLYTTGTKIYEEVWFPTIATGKNIDKYYILQKEWKQCDDKNYGIGGGRGCSNVTGYTHAYTIPILWLQIEAYKNALPDYSDNPWIFQPTIVMPFTISGNVITEIRKTWIYTKKYQLEYHDMKPTDTREEIISTTTKWYTNTERKKIDDQNYVVLYEDWDQYITKKFLFQTGKNYYYIYTTPWDCNPWPCGFDRHETIFFTK